MLALAAARGARAIAAVGLSASLALPSASVGAQAIIAGTVFADSTNRPIANAEVTITALGRSARTDSAGNFTLTNVAAGMQLLTIRALGYAPQTQRLPLRDGQTLESDFFLKRSAQQLEAVDVTANAAPGMSMRMRMSGFEERKKLGFGHFLTRDDFEKFDGRKLADMMVGRMPGLRIYYDRQGGRWLVSKKNLGKGPCYVRVYIDGLLFNPDVPYAQQFSPDRFDPSQFAGAEYYSTAATPPQFNATGAQPCGTLVLWTRD